MGGFNQCASLNIGSDLVVVVQLLSLIRLLATPWTAAHQASLLAQLVKNLPAVQETPVRFLGWEDPLEKEMAIHSSILA